MFNTVNANLLLEYLEKGILGYGVSIGNFRDD
jgi:hypothetical protein